MTKTAKVEDFTAEAQKSMEQGVEKFTKGFEDATSFGQDTVEAMVASSKIAAKALESMNAEVLAFSKKSYEDSLAAAKEMSSCKSVSELVEKQTAFGKTSMEAFLAQATRMNDLATAAAKDAFEPINARFSAAVDMVKGARA